MARILAILVLLGVSFLAHAQGKLGQVRDEVKKSKPDDDKSQEDSSADPQSTTSDEEDDPFGWMAVRVFLAPWVLPYEMIDGGAKALFTSHPYSAPDAPFLAVSSANNRESPYYNDAITQPYSIRGGFELGSDFDGLTRAGVRLFLDTETRFGLKSDWDYYHERLDCGCHDSLWIGDITATFRFVQCEHIQMHTGLGARMMFDGGDDRGGINFLYGFDAFPVKPVHLFGSFEAGTLGSAGVWRLHGGIGFNWTFAELFAGYDYFRIGSATLQGPFVGLRMWF